MTVMSYRYGGTPAPGGYHYGLGGIGIRGDALPDYGAAGVSLQYPDVTLPGEAADEFRVVLLTTPTLGTLLVYEDSSFEYSGPDGVHTFSYAGYKNGVLYGTGTITLVIGEGLAGSIAFDSFLLEGAFEGSLVPPDVLGRRIGPRTALRANGELLVLF